MVFTTGFFKKDLYIVYILYKKNKQGEQHMKIDHMRNKKKAHQNKNDGQKNKKKKVDLKNLSPLQIQVS